MPFVIFDQRDLTLGHQLYYENSELLLMYITKNLFSELYIKYKRGFAPKSSQNI